MENAKFASGILASVLFSAACSVFADVTVSEPWVRGVVEGQTETGAFMILKSSEATKLISAASPVAKKVQIHEMKMHGDKMMMRPIKALAIPADSAFELKPGGYHVMLIGLNKPLVKGDKVPIKLTFRSKAGAKSTLDIQAEIRDLNYSATPAAMDPMQTK